MFRAASLPPRPPSYSDGSEEQTFLHMPVAMELMLPRSLHGVSVRGSIKKRAQDLAEKFEAQTRGTALRGVGEIGAKVVSNPTGVAQNVINDGTKSINRYNFHFQHIP